VLRPVHQYLVLVTDQGRSAGPQYCLDPGATETVTRKVTMLATSATCFFVYLSLFLLEWGRPRSHWPT
jgi:hypothetical protein